MLRFLMQGSVSIDLWVQNGHQLLEEAKTLQLEKEDYNLVQVLLRFQFLMDLDHIQGFLFLLLE